MLQPVWVSIQMADGEGGEHDAQVRVDGVAGAIGSLSY